MKHYSLIIGLFAVLIILDNSLLAATFADEKFTPENVQEIIYQAEAGNPEYQELLGLMYKEGKGVNQDYTKALLWLHKAAQSNYPSAINSLGFMYDSGLGVKKDKKRAVLLYKKAADLGDTTAQANIAIAFEKGKGGFPKDHIQAIKWYRKAAEQGEAIAQYKLGNIYGKGIVVEKDYTEAFKWISMAAKQGHTNAEYLLGRIYRKGFGVEKDPEASFNWYMKAATNGHSQAEYGIANFYYHGVHVKKDFDKALYWFRTSAAKKNLSSMNALAWICSTSKNNNIRNGKDALPLILKAIENKPNKAKYHDTLAAAYAENGNYKEAIAIQKKAISLLDKKKEKVLIRYKKRLDSYMNNQPWRE